jgi:hypothetical protein
MIEPFERNIFIIGFYYLCGMPFFLALPVRNAAPSACEFCVPSKKPAGLSPRF